MDDKTFQFPPSLLEQINECSDGGFVLFNFDDQKNPRVFCRYDDCKSALALQNFIEIWCRTCQEANFANAVNNFTEDEEEEEEEGWHDDDEDEG